MNAPTSAFIGRLGPRQGEVAPGQESEWRPLAMTDLARLRVDPLRLPVIQAIYSGVGALTMVLAEQSYQLEWRCPPALAKAPYLLSLRTRSGGLQLALDVQDVLAFWPAEEFPISKSLLAIHLLEECSLLIRWLEESFNTVMVGLELTTHPQPFRPLLSLGITNTATRAEGSVHILSMPTTWAVDRLKRQRTGASAALLQQTLTFRLRLNIGQTVIDSRELRALEVGDILIMDKWTSVDGNLRIEGCIEDASSALLVMTADGQRATVKSIHLQGFHMQPNELHSDAINSAHIDELEVTLNFQLGERRIKLGELQDIRPGYVFDLDTALNRSTIRVVVNGRSVAAGQLMAVGERLGVRITRIAGTLSQRD